MPYLNKNNVFYSRLSIFALLSIMFMTSCAETEEHVVSAELQEYFDSFQAEAHARGITIDYDALLISAGLVDINSSTVVGQCRTYDDDSRDIYFDRQYWIRLSETEREYVMYHELGHCALGRGHTNVKNGRGFCTSIMQDGLGECIKLYNRTTREELLDELFDN